MAIVKQTTYEGNKYNLGTLERTAISGVVNHANKAMNSVVLSGGGATVLSAANAGATCVFDTAAASTFTLPSPELGMRFTFITTITATADHVIQAGTNTYGFLGGVHIMNTTADQTNAFSAAVDGENDFITLNGSTTGGIAGTMVHVAAILGANAVRAWVVHGTLIGSGNTVTPFADAQI